MVQMTIRSACAAIRGMWGSQPAAGTFAIVGTHTQPSPLRPAAQGGCPSSG